MNTTSSRIYSKNSLSKIGRKINYLDLKIDSASFSGLRLSTSIILFGILIFINYSYIYAPLFIITYYILFEYILLDMNIVRRRKKLENAAIEFFPLFLLNLSSGRNIKKAIISTCELLEDNYLTKEFNKVINDTTIGKTFEESLKMMTTRVPSEIIVNIIYSILEANKSGNGLNNSINEQIDYLKNIKTNKIINNQKYVPLKMLVVFTIFTMIMISIMVIYKMKF